MTYTDKDLLHLYEDLQGIGAAQTPEEEAESICREFISYADEHIDSSTMKWIPEVNQALTRFLLGKGIPITFVLVSRPDPQPRESLVRTIFPLYKGLVIYPKVLPLADYIQEKAWTEDKVSTFDTIDQLQAGVKEVWALRAKTHNPAGVRINPPIRHTNTTSTP